MFNNLKNSVVKEVNIKTSPRRPDVPPQQSQHIAISSYIIYIIVSYCIPVSPLVLLSLLSPWPMAYPHGPHGHGSPGDPIDSKNLRPQAREHAELRGCPWFEHSDCVTDGFKFRSRRDVERRGGMAAKKPSKLGYDLRYDLV